jgi:hypothetical protein
MKVSRGKVHKYLSMTLDYTVCRKAKITMFDYVDEILTAFGKTEPKTVLIPQVRSAHKYPISPWEMIHLPGGDNAVRR